MEENGVWFPRRDIFEDTLETPKDIALFCTDRGLLLALVVIKFVVQKELTEQNPESVFVKKVLEEGMLSVENAGKKQRALFLNCLGNLHHFNKHIVEAVVNMEQWLPKVVKPYLKLGSPDEARIHLEIAKIVLRKTGIGAEVKGILKTGILQTIKPFDLDALLPPWFDCVMQSPLNQHGGSGCEIIVPNDCDGDCKQAVAYLNALMK